MYRRCIQKALGTCTRWSSEALDKLWEVPRPELSCLGETSNQNTMIVVILWRRVLYPLLLPDIYAGHFYAHLARLTPK